MNQAKQNRILAILHIILFLLLLTLSILILKGVVVQFFSEDSTFKTYDGKIDEYPTITICTRDSELEYGIDLNLTIVSTYAYNIVKGENTWIEYGENIKLEQFYSFIISGFCYKITRNMSRPIKNMHDGYAELILYFNNSISYSKLPDLEFYFTSEKNSLGAVYYEWMEGEDLLVNIPKVSIDDFAILSEI